MSPGGKAWAVATIHESGDLSGAAVSNPFAREGAEHMARVLVVAAAAHAGCRPCRRRPQETKKLDPVIVTGTKIETPAEQVGATVTVIDGEEIETRIYPTVDEALRHVPGVEIRRSGSFGKTTSISIRGANPNQVQVLVDGVRVKSPTLGQVDLADIAPDVDRADRDHPRTAVDHLRRRRHRRRGAASSPSGEAGRPPRTPPRRSATTTPTGLRPASAAPGRPSTTRSATTTWSPTASPSTTA